MNLLKSYSKPFSDSKNENQKLKKDFLEKICSTIENDVTLIANVKETILNGLLMKEKLWKNKNSTNAQFAWYRKNLDLN